MLAACSDDAGGAVDASAACLADEECEDGVFCNGRERCAPDDPTADARGCVGGASPCGPGQVCAEAAAVCATDCSVAEDLDGDGVAAPICGGDDCDDTDPDRFPGNPEVCDAEGKDEDCDPTTVGDVDVDDDGYVSALCCNGDTCGRDCDDERPSTSPVGAEVCNGLDDDCDGDVDEEVLRTFYADLDDDGYGDATDEQLACEAPEGYALRAGDCDDSDPAVRPNAAELCDTEGVDEDCSGAADDAPGGCSCAAGGVRGCLLPGVCQGSAQVCGPDGRWGACAVGPASQETCGDSLDNDCDSAVDEGCACAVSSRLCGIDEGACQRGIQDCLPDGSWGECRDDITPAPETCNARDDDCDGTVDEGAATSCWVDNDNDGFAELGSANRRLDCGTTACPTGETAVDPTVQADCDDSDDRAFPGQTQFFTTPRNAGGFDFDCSGAPERGPGPSQPARGSCPSTEPCNDGVYFTASAAPCGGYAEVYTCYGTGDSSRSCARAPTCSGTPGPSTCPNTSGSPQACR